MDLYTSNPLTDPRWDCFVDRHPHSSALHQRGWLGALAQTYGYKPWVLTSTAPGQPLHDGVVFCRVSSWFTGTRLVSLPFADHCDPLLGESQDAAGLLQYLKDQFDKEGYKYVELRPLLDLKPLKHGLSESASYIFHTLDLRPELKAIFGNLHKDSVQRRIRRAEKEGISLARGNDDVLLDEFYRLLLITRRRHGLFPQPRKWFENLIRYMGDKVCIWVARKGTNPVAAILTLRHKSSLIYKYGCSDGTFHRLGAIPFLFWRLIEESKARGLETIDFGRSDLHNRGLIQFKDRLGTSKRVLTYCRYSRASTLAVESTWTWKAMQGVLPVLPNSVVSMAGGVLYRHMG